MSYIPYNIIANFGSDYISYNEKSGEVRYNCPYCVSVKGTPDTKGHLYVNSKTLVYHCYRCDSKGYINKNVKVSQSRVYDEDKDKDIEDTISSINSILTDKNEYKLKIPIDKVTSSAKATEYLLNRGFTYKQMEYYDIRVGNLKNEFGRIIIPNIVSNIVYTDMYSARSYIGQTPKYHNPSEVKKSHIVFNLHRIKDGSPIILVEGALTAIAAGYHAVASLGKNLSKYQASMIASKKPSVVFVNYDYGAEDCSREACKLLKSYMPYTKIMEVLMKDERDAADMTHEEYAECLSNAKEYLPVIDDICSLL